MSLRNLIWFIVFGLLYVVFVGCTPLGKSITTFAVFEPKPGPTNPAGSLVYDPSPAEVKLEPSSLTFQPNDPAEKQVTLKVKDKFVWSVVGFCVTNCAVIGNWSKANGEFTGTIVQSSPTGKFLDGSQGEGVQATITLPKENLSQGNNFLAFYSCNGIGLCHGGKWVNVSFNVNLVSATCDDGQQNGGESDKDCGGQTTCPRCGVDQKCIANSDCGSNRCVGGFCQRATCGDTIKNQDETDVDCGGSCKQQQPPQRCFYGKGCNVDDDCEKGQCDATKKCTERCNSNADCEFCGTGCFQTKDTTPSGYPRPDVCTASQAPAGVFCVCRLDTSRCISLNANTAKINIKPQFFEPNNITVANGTNVTWVNLAGEIHTVTSYAGQPESFNSGDLIANNQFWYVFTKNGTTNYKSDISPRRWSGNVTTYDIKGTCGDGIKYGNETDIDCGGACTTKCPDGKKCKVASDCQSNVCTNEVCQTAPGCNNNRQDPGETDVDCGGSITIATHCPRCDDGKKCLVDTDCTGKKCKPDAQNVLRCTSLPDYIVKEITFLPLLPPITIQSNSLLPIVFKLENIGTANRTQQVQLQYNVTFPDSPGKAEIKETILIDSPNFTIPASILEKSINIPLGSSLSVNVTAIIDPINQVEELNENNNRNVTETSFSLTDPGLPGRQTTSCTSNTDCSGGNVCDTATKICVQCLDNNNCPPGKKCDTATKTCVDKCQGVSCQSGQVCNPSDGACVQCVSDSNCPGKKCDATTHTCIDKCQGVTCSGATPKCDPATGGCAQCLDSTHCLDGKICASATKTCVQCISDSNCPAGKRCDTTTKTCVEKCVGVTCLSGQVCNPADEQCVACLDDSNCPNKKCDTATHTCVDKCQGVSCTGTTPKCNPATGGCVQCLATADCSSGQACTNNQCVTVTPQCVTYTVNTGSGYAERALPTQCFGRQCSMALTPQVYFPSGLPIPRISYIQYDSGQYSISGLQCSYSTGSTSCIEGAAPTSGINGDGNTVWLMATNGCIVLDDVAGMFNKNNIVLGGNCKLEIC